MQPHALALGLIVAISGGSLGAGGALAQSVSAAWPESLVSALQDAGYRARLTRDGHGDPKIESAVAGADFEIFFYGCDMSGAACTDVQFIAGFDLAAGISVQAANSWNREKLMGEAYVDEEGDPFIEYFLPGLDGMSRHSFNAILDRWETALSEFTAYIDW